MYLIMRYRRVYIKGGCYFFTVVTEKRRKFFADADNVERLRMAFKTVMEKRPFVIDAAVVLPDHYLKTTATIQHAGGSSNPHLLNNSLINLLYKILIGNTKTTSDMATSSLGTLPTQ